MQQRHCFVRLAVICLAVAPAVAGEAVPRGKVGQIAQEQYSTPHPYAPGQTWTFEIHEPGATYLKVHLSRFELAPGDWLEVLSADRTERYVFHGKGYKNKGRDFWVNSVLGDRVTLRLNSVTGGGYGFDVDYYAFGNQPLFPEPEPSAPESVCGQLDWEDVACYENSYPTEFNRAKRAVVVLYNGVENCSGVKVGCPNQFLSNEHCITNQFEVDLTEVRFEYQRSGCSTGSTTFSESYLGDEFIADDYTLDYSLFTCEGSSASYQVAEIDDRLPPAGERIYISGHPAGGPKKLSLESTHPSNPGGLCEVDFSPIDGRGPGTDVGYFCDTTGGSSGSPVWSGSSHKLIALHHFGGCPNSGVRMDLIFPQIENLLDGCGGGGGGGRCLPIYQQNSGLCGFEPDCQQNQVLNIDNCAGEQGIDLLFGAVAIVGAPAAGYPGSYAWVAREPGDQPVKRYLVVLNGANGAQAVDGGRLIVNGEVIFEAGEIHAGTGWDQRPITLQPGANSVVLENLTSVLGTLSVFVSDQPLLP